MKEQGKSKLKGPTLSEYLFGAGKYFLYQHQGLIHGFWHVHDQGPMWGWQWGGTLVTTPFALVLGIVLALRTDWWWAIAGAIICRLMCSLMYWIQDRLTDNAGWMLVQDLVGRFFWVIYTTTVAILLTQLFFFILNFLK